METTGKTTNILCIQRSLRYDILRIKRQKIMQKSRKRKQQSQKKRCVTLPYQTYDTIVAP